MYLSGRGQFGRYLIREYARPADRAQDRRCSGDHHRPVQRVLNEAGLLTVAVPRRRGDVPGYRLSAAVIHWQAGSGLSGAEDRVRRTLDNEEGPRVNPFFRELYRDVAATLAGLRAKEHTAQVPPAERQEREGEFSDGSAAGPVLLADHGTRGGHQRAERRRAAQRAADAGQLRPAGRAAPGAPGSPRWW